ncbi:MAG: MFS transporter, partial [Termitinemataceae bacterium]
GRKLGFMATIGIDSLFGFLSAFSPNFGVFLVLRMLTGFGVGGTLPVDYAVFAEFLPAKDRGKRLVLLESFWALGTIVAAGAAWLVVPRFGWRFLFIVSAVPGLLLFAVRTWVPESPRFLAASGKRDEAMAVLSQVAKINGRSLDHTTLPEDTILPPADLPRTTVKDLFSRDLRRTTILLWIIWFFISIGYYGIFTWLPSWLRSKGFALPAIYPYSFFMALAQLPGYFSAAYLVERIGRRRTLGLYLLGSGFGAVAFSFAVSQTSIVTAALVLSFFALGAWGALYAYTPEAYPTVIRTTGIGTASGMTRIAGVIAPFVGAMLGTSDLFGALILFGTVYGLGALAAFALPYESAGSVLEDVV